MNPQELYEAYMSVYESDDRREMRRLASQERQAEKKAESEFRSKSGIGAKKKGPKLSATKMSKSEGENYAKQTMKDAEHIAKKAKGHTVGNPFPEHVDYFDQVLSELIDAGYTAEQALEYMLQEADSMAAFQARREKRLQAQRKREGRASDGTDFGHDYGKPRAQADAEREKRMKDFINKEEYELDEEITSEKGKAKAAEMIAKRSTASGRAKPGQGASVDRIKHISRANVENLGGTPATPTIAKNPVKSRSYGGTGNKAARRAGLTPTREKPNAWKEEYVDEAQYARNNPEKYEREQEKKQSSRERRMNDPKTGINSKAFNDFYNAQMGRKKN